MILILGEKNNVSTAKVIGYLKRKNFLRVNDKFPIKKNYLSGDSNFDLEYSFSSFSKIWYYRSILEPSVNKIQDDITVNEYKLFIEYILYDLKRKIIGSFYQFFFQNTLIQLIEAEKVGLKIPKTVVNTSFPDFGNSKVVNKIIGTTKSFATKDYIYSTTGTQFINKEEYIENGHLNFFQEYIEKEFEIRIFYFLGKFFSMAIFSQKDDMTSIDFRNYNRKKPNRRTPYKLPTIIEKKICKMMQDLELISGSIDFIKNTQNEYVFLEVNPNGEFCVLSSTCNYKLEYLICKYIQKKMKSNYEK